jgi:hypothetical protein
MPDERGDVVARPMRKWTRLNARRPLQPRDRGAFVQMVAQGLVDPFGPGIIHRVIEEVQPFFNGGTFVRAKRTHPREY